MITGDTPNLPALVPSGGEANPDSPADSRGGGSFFSRLFRRATDPAQPSAEPEIGDLGEAFQASSPVEQAMALNILRMRDLRIEDAMTPRADIVAVPDDANLDTVIKAFESKGLSRLPVYRETLDDPLGFVHLKDLALRYGVGQGRDCADFKLTDHIRTALFVPPSMRVSTLLQKMQAARVHMALVIDEFGGVDGIATIEDLVEQIVGDIADEHDREELAQWREETPGVYLIDARTDIREFEEASGLALLPDDWDEEVDTLGGLVFMLTNRVPARGEVIAHPLGHEFQVLDADSRRIKRLRLIVHGAAERRAAQ